jgi:hypothetical protein
MGGISFGMAQQGQRLTPQKAIAAARRNALTPGSSFSVLKKIVANDDTRRIGDQALEQARTHKVKLYESGILADLLRSGGFLLAETKPRTNNVIAFHLISLGSDGVPKDSLEPCHGVVKLADAKELVKDTTEFAEALYSTPASEASSLESRFYGGSFPECGPSKECDQFAIPSSLLKLGADQSEYREVVALFGGLQLLGFRYAASMPVFAASPLAATQATEEKWETLQAEFLRSNHMAPDFDFDLENIRSKEQLRERIDVLRRLDKFMEAALMNEANPALVKANITVATICLGVGIYDGLEEGQMLYGSGTASLLVFYWQRLRTGGFAVKIISEAG